MIKVLFQKGWKGYIKGDIAGFSDEEAQFLKVNGFAFSVDDSHQPDLKGGLNLPVYDKVENLCAICGEHFDGVDALKAHRAGEHGI